MHQGSYRHLQIEALLLGLVLTGCGAGWTLTKVGTIEGLDEPESAVVDPQTGLTYVTNLAPPDDPPEYWVTDNSGFLSRVSASLALVKVRWVVGTAERPIDSPKGICMHKGLLHVADCGRILRFDPASGKPKGVVAIPGAKGINDLLSDGELLYASDTMAAKVYRIGDDPSKPHVIPAPAGVNGMELAGTRLLTVSWSEKDLFELDPAGKAAPKAFGLRGMGSLDELKALPDGTLLVSDYENGRIVAVSPDGKHVRTLAEVRSPADIFLDRARMLLIVPSMLDNRAVVYRVEKK